MTDERKGTDMSETLRIVAEPVDRAIPTVGPWFITCSDCGPVAMADTTTGCDAAIITHTKLHGGRA